MTATDQPRPQSGASQFPPGVPRLGGDELFVPASHVLVIDHQVSHPAFRLWCVLHRLWFLHEPPVMELLQELMGTTITDKATQTETWQPATRRSIERWLTELEQSGWLVWARRGETTRRYHLRTSARSATDTAVLTELRTLLNSGKATWPKCRRCSTWRHRYPPMRHQSRMDRSQDRIRMPNRPLSWRLMRHQGRMRLAMMRPQSRSRWTDGRLIRRWSRMIRS